MRTGIVIGAGPSIFKYHHLKRLHDFAFEYGKKSYLLITDKMLKPCLEAGITPDLFLNYYVFTVEDMWQLDEFISNVKEAPKIRLIHSIRAKQPILDKARKIGYNLICDKWPYLDVLDNVGLMAFSYGWRVLKCDELILLGMDSTNYEPLKFGENTDCYKEFYRKVNGYNLTPLEQLWYDGFMDLLQLAPDNLKILNATGGGILQHPRIITKPLEDCLHGKP